MSLESSVPSNQQTTELVDDRDVMIKVENVTMMFNKASEQLNNLKEYAIKLARGELFFEGFTALDDINLEIRRGDIFGIVGSNGSGKSTLLKIVAGVLDPTQGSCTINGKIAPLIELGAGFDQELTARENIYLNGALLGYSQEFVEEHFDSIVAFAEIEPFLDMPLKNYSSGMVARIAFAIATVIVPDILICDEVLAVGDFMFQQKCEDRLNELINQHGVTVLIVSHVNDQIERLCNKVVWIEKGQQQMIGDAKTVCRLYNAMGGRTGSPEAKENVQSQIWNLLESDISSPPFKTYSGENYIETAVNICEDIEGLDDVDTLILATNRHHAHSIIPMGLAGAKNSVVLPLSHNRIQDPIKEILEKVRPQNIVLIDCERTLDTLTGLLNELNIASTITQVPGADFLAVSTNYSLQYRQEGLLSDELILIDFDDNPESFVIGPYLYAHRAGVIMTKGGAFPNRSDVLSQLKDAGYRKVLATGTTLNRDNAQAFADAGFDVTIISEGTMAQTNRALYEHFLQDEYFDGDTLIACPLSISQWPELLATAPLAAQKHSPILSVMNSSYDEFLECLELVGRKQCSSAIFFGNSRGFSDADREIFTLKGMTSG